MVGKRKEIQKLIAKEVENRRAVLATSLKKRFKGHIDRGQREPYLISDPNTPREVIDLAVKQLEKECPHVTIRCFREGLYDKVQFLF